MNLVDGLNHFICNSCMLTSCKRSATDKMTSCDFFKQDISKSVPKMPRDYRAMITDRAERKQILSDRRFKVVEIEKASRLKWEKITGGSDRLSENLLQEVKMR